MSTRSTTHFAYGFNPDGTPRTAAIVYRHSDGYPEGHGKDLVERFFAEVEAQTQDTRYSDPDYLAAKLVVWLAGEFAVDYDWSTNPYTVKPTGRPLDFLSVGVCLEDPSDIEYRYIVDCSYIDPETKRPKVWIEGADGGDRQLVVDVLAKPQEA